ncbi:MAG: type IV pilus secretin PilQ [Myxococcales bacterium]|nr:type IV pilus secretin PilQ [Myxococcales bacterium]MCB9579451.1 type IV pilus secretin PilQ [Polyangiaceae bacterium]
MRWTSPRLSSALTLGLALAILTPARAEAAGSASRHATRIQVARTGNTGAAQVTVSFTAAPTFSARLDKQRKRLIIDVPDADIRGAPGAVTKRTGVIGGVLAQTFDTNGSKTTRVLVTLLEDAKYSVRVDGTKLVVAFEPGSLGVLDKKRAVTLETKAPAAETGIARVSDVRFEHQKSRDDVVIELSENVRYRLSKSGKNRARLVIDGASLPEALSRTLDASAFGGSVRAVSSYAPNGSSDQVVIEVETAEAENSIARRGHSLVWSFYEPGALPSSVTGVAADGGVARKTRTVYVEPDFEDIPKVHDGYVEQSGGDEAAAVTPGVLGQTRGRYTGRRVDLDLKDADVHNVLRLLADVGRVNIVTADNVSGNVTIRMRNVPWDQALDVVLQAKGLGMVRQGNMIRVAPLSDLEKEREMAIARRKQEMQLAPIETRLIPVSYASAGDIQDRAKDLLSERGSIAVDERTNVMIVRDVAGNLNQIEELTRSLDTQTPQVLVEARIVEATSRYLRDVGIQWGGDATFSGATGNSTGLVFPNSVGVVGGASDSNTPTGGLSPFTNSVPNPNFAVNLPATVGTGQGGAIGLSFGSIDNTINLAVRLSAAESSGMLRILSSPRILTMDNQQARISQGTLIPFSQISAQGVQTTFQEAKLQLLVKPHVTADGSISMKVKINRDEPDFNQTSPRGDPTILKREAETNLLVMDGHTAVIGGIFTRNTGRNLDQVPFFGDIPLIGLLFQRRRASDTRGELVIFLTPRIVNRAEALGR